MKKLNNNSKKKDQDIKKDNLSLKKKKLEFFKNLKNLKLFFLIKKTLEKFKIKIKDNSTKTELHL